MDKEGQKGRVTVYILWPKPSAVAKDPHIYLDISTLEGIHIEVHILLKTLSTLD